VLLFSAKEAAIKALSPTLQRFVDFPELRVQFDETAFTAALDGSDLGVVGWWTIVMDKLILTGAALL
jgi:4'-phosphopantetheinyl transferase EntD